MLGPGVRLGVLLDQVTGEAVQPSIGGPRLPRPAQVAHLEVGHRRITQPPPRPYGCCNGCCCNEFPCDFNELARALSRDTLIVFQKAVTAIHAMSLGGCCAVLTDSEAGEHAKKFGVRICPTRNLRGSTKEFMSTQHTPGPWLADAWLGPDPWEYPDTPFVQIGDVKWCPDKLEVPAAVRQYADATLMAAAPDLLEALHGLMNAVQKSVCDGSGQAQDKARQAIAKATGGAA